MTFFFFFFFDRRLKSMLASLTSAAVVSDGSVSSSPACSSDYNIKRICTLYSMATKLDFSIFRFSLHKVLKKLLNPNSPFVVVCILNKSRK